MRSQNQKNWLAAYCCLAAILTGCRTSMSTQYGLSDGVDARYSPASVSLFRNLCNMNERTTLAVRSLTPSAMSRLNAIVWSPDSFEPHKPETIAWLDRWLATGNRTLVYVGRDFSPTADYWSQTSSHFSANMATQTDALNAKEQEAMELSALDRMRSAVRPRGVTPWCIFDHRSGVQTQLSKVAGPWSESTDASKARFFFRSYPVSYEEETFSKLVTELDWEPKVDTSTKPVNANAYERKWQDSDANLLKTVKSLSSSSLPKMKSLLSSQDGIPLIAEVTSLRWGASRIIVLANSSLISNLSLINSENMKVAKRLMSELPNRNIGFLTGSQDPPVRNDDFGNQQKGFEMLTMWPLNVISLHAVFLGMLVLLAAFPIFGRAKQLPAKSTREFSQHVEAVGGLLSKSQDRHYALAIISEYFRTVRKEPTSPWAHLDPLSKQAPQSPFQNQNESDRAN